MQMHKQSTQFDPNQYISNKHYKEVAQKKVYFFSPSQTSADTFTPTKVPAKCTLYTW